MIDGERQPALSTAELFASARPRYPELRGRVALVTGASRGIGQGIAIRLAAEGMRVAVTARSREPLEAFARELADRGAEALAVAADLRSRSDVERLFEEVLASWHTIDLLVNNAADLRRLPVFEVTDELFDEVVAANVRGPWLCARRAAKIMREHGGGCIVNVSSVGGLRAHHPGLPYDATKSALDGLTRSLGVELAPFGIRVNAVAPGATDVGRGHLGEADRTALLRRIPIGRRGLPLDMAAAVAFFASEEASYVVGQTLYVDGGITAQLAPPPAQV